MNCRLSELVIDCTDPVELDRLLSFGARPVDVGQTGEESWHALQDPEGNEFCLLRRQLPELPGRRAG